MKIIDEKVREIQTQHIKDVITKKEYWKADKFRVLNNEAGFGKSYISYEAIADIALEGYRVVYVQKFANENTEEQDAKKLKKTVKAIEGWAWGNEIVNYLASDNKKDHNKIIKEHSVICITHKKYMESCKEKSNFITDADILICDEFIDLCKELEISDKELKILSSATSVFKDYRKEILQFHDYIKKEIEEKYNTYGTTEMSFVNLKPSKKMMNILSNLETMVDKKHDLEDIKEVLFTCRQILTRSCLYSTNNAFITYDNRYNYLLAKQSNIMLDANAGFDGRYSLNPIFELDPQSKVFDYTSSSITLYQIATTKNALTRTKNIVNDARNYLLEKQKVGFNKKPNSLIVSSKKVRENLSFTDLQLEQDKLVEGINYTHFGFIIGKNDWKNCDDVWILFTPYFQWHTYLIEYMYYSPTEKFSGSESCKIESIQRNDGYEKKYCL
ncbi:hypothetical protein [Clostridium formicaceticum]|uniref:Uncharacterized protein n=1 Tax=Clostridium formicaceticum TaxID=1497 RepID=A0AAC9WG24_9CLOT|nr:hypothetical protein [Clostridium formicaceticum]AOY76896.1 hypothetical protein BJL90_14160 [Clostridium formicaceticum]ARE87376.1 hypothetical protein CLFO_17760 [Clostridium formicaceticum]